jgi:hypothetical protein
VRKEGSLSQEMELVLGLGLCVRTKSADLSQRRWQKISGVTVTAWCWRIGCTDESPLQDSAFMRVRNPGLRPGLV